MSARIYGATVDGGRIIVAESEAELRTAAAEKRALAGPPCEKCSNRSFFVLAVDLLACGFCDASYPIAPIEVA